MIRRLLVRGVRLSTEETTNRLLEGRGLLVMHGDEQLRFGVGRAADPPGDRAGGAQNGPPIRRPVRCVASTATPAERGRARVLSP